MYQFHLGQSPDSPVEELAICHEHYETIGSFQWGYVAVKSFGLIITLANFVTRQIMIALAHMIRCASVSREARFIRNSVFVMSFFNTGLLYVFASISTRESGIYAVESTLEGVYPDFTSSWYDDIGTIILATTIFNIAFIPVEWCLWATIRLLKRCWNRSCRTNNHYSTKSKTIQHYVDVYKGPIFNAHYKYSYMLSVTYVAMLYGPG